MYRACMLLALLAVGTNLAAAARSTLETTSECGKPGTLCGASLPPDVKCNKGPGYCDPGYFCGWTFSDTDKTTRCMPVPQGCGEDGDSCCPGNNAAAIVNATSTPKPYCSDGSHCFYTPTPDASGWSAPPYASPAGPLLGTCHKVPTDCGTAAGTPCCPSLYHIRVNPPLPNPSMGSMCSGNLFCQYNAPGSKSFNLNWPTGTCVANKLDCGKFGKSCCITTTGVATNAACGVQWGQEGQAGYCAYPGGKPTGDMSDQICMTCPSKSVVAANSGRYFPCPAE